MIYLHPVLGGLSVGLLLWIGLQGLRARHPKPYAAPARARHERWVYGIYALILLSGVTGVLSTTWLRAELAPGGSWHFWLGSLTILLLTAGWLCWKLPDRALARQLHPWVGVAALGTALVQAALGLGLLP